MSQYYAWENDKIRQIYVNRFAEKTMGFSKKHDEKTVVVYQK